MKSLLAGRECGKVTSLLLFEEYAFLPSKPQSGITRCRRKRSAIALARTSTDPDKRADFFERGAGCREHGVTIGRLGQSGSNLRWRKKIATGSGPCKDNGVAPESENNLRFEIGHVLFIDLVGYSKLLIEDQKERLRQLTEIVLATSQVAKSTNEQLVRLPTGDGMALVFRNSSEEPARCALEIAQALRTHPDIAVRMGIHSGPVSEVTDVSGRSNIAGAGINIAQRVMDCGDAGHLLLSKHVADDLSSMAIGSRTCTTSAIAR